METIEIWKDIVGYEGLYQISNLGRVKSLKRVKTKILSPTPNSSGYLYVKLSKKGFKPFNGRTHRLVAKAFISNPENKPQVNHIDGNKLNNNIENLEWNTASENQQHAYDNGLKKPNWLNKKGKYNPNSKIIYQYTKSDEFIKKWNCIRDVERELKINNGDISSCALGKLKSAGGFRWSYTKL